MSNKVEKSVECKAYFVITGGVIGYMELEIADNIGWNKVEEQVRSYNMVQEELWSGCHMHVEIRTVTTETVIYEF